MYDAILTPIRRIRNSITQYFTFYQDTVFFRIDDAGRVNAFDPYKTTEVAKEKNLRLGGKEQKAFFQVHDSFFTFLFQEFPTVMLFYSRIKNRNIKLYINITYKTGESYHSLIDFMIKYLKDIGVPFEIINTEKYSIVESENIYVFANAFGPMAINTMYAKTRKYVRDKSLKPFRKVFVARKDVLQKRIDSSEKIASYFASIGFEVVYPEDFESFIDQINYFSECSVIAGLSGSGLSNCIFMKQGGTVIEVSSVFDVGNVSYPIEIHDFYRVMAMYRGHIYFSVSNVSKKFEDVIKNHKATSFMQMV